jgi:Pyruvate/2-oxoacid:ferredoxin oxidoreductase delta subunit
MTTVPPARLTSLLASAGEGGSGGLDVKLFQEPLLPIAGTSVDLTPFVLMAVMLTVSSLCMRITTAPAWTAYAAQALAAGVWGLVAYLMGGALIETIPAPGFGPGGLRVPDVNGSNVLVLGILGAGTVGFLLLFWETTGPRQSFRLASQTTSFGAFVLSIHPCACLIRDAMIGLNFLNSDNMRAFEFLIVIVTVGAFTMAWGRSFCGWVCPIGFVQELVTKLTAFSRRLSDQRTVTRVRWAACVVFLAIVVVGFVLPGPASMPFYQGMLVYWVVALLVLTLTVLSDPKLEKRLWLVRFASLALFAGTIWWGTYLNGVFCVLLKNILAKPTVILFAGVLFTTLLLSQAWCRFLCPEGALLGILTRFSGWKVTLEKSKCSGCNVCKDVCPVEAIDIGRVNESVCLYCCKCIDACPTDALDMERTAPPARIIPLPLAAR